MITIIYKKLGNKYCITNIEGEVGEEITMIFDVPVPLKVIIGNISKITEYGVCRFKASEIGEGYHSPKVFVGGEVTEAEGFRMIGKRLLANNLDDEFVRRLAELTSELGREVSELKAAVNYMTDLMSEKRIF